MKKTKRETKSENVTTTGLVYGSPVRVQNAATRVTRESRPQRHLPRTVRAAKMIKISGSPKEEKYIISYFMGHG